MHSTEQWCLMSPLPFVCFIFCSTSSRSLSSAFPAKEKLNATAASVIWIFQREIRLVVPPDQMSASFFYAGGPGANQNVSGSPLPISEELYKYQLAWPQCMPWRGWWILHNINNDSKKASMTAADGCLQNIICGSHGLARCTDRLLFEQKHPWCICYFVSLCSFILFLHGIVRAGEELQGTRKNMPLLLLWLFIGVVIGVGTTTTTMSTSTTTSSKAQAWRSFAFYRSNTGSTAYLANCQKTDCVSWKCHHRVV